VAASIELAANGVTDADGSVAGVAFYRETTAHPACRSVPVVTRSSATPPAAETTLD